MAKISAEELSSKINDLELDDEIKISLMEDITDSVKDESEELSNLKEELEKTKSEYSDLQSRYKERFLESDKVSTKKEEKEELKDLEEKQVIDIKSI